MTEKNHHPDLLSAQKKDIYYNLVMFPYPSGFGLHVWHASNYTITDVNARFQRMLGKIVLNPFGFDSFWLPTENYAMKQGKPAYEVTKENTDMFLKQIEALNMSFDMDRLIYTSNPDYYKWTQWIFTKLYQHWLVYRDELYVNRCPECQTVLANDQVVDGKCERCSTEILQKKHPQRFIKITDYADRLIKDLDLVDRPEETKIGQKNRIGRSEWAEIDFTVEKEVTITCFTTRPDTIYGVTALVLAPENTDIDKLLNDQKKKEVKQYRQQTLAKTAVQRQQEAKEKTGIFSGIYAKHPLTNQDIPIRFADYVLADYGSWAVMIVPAHDQRDREFANKFDIGIIEVIKPKDKKDKKENKAYTGDGTLINSDILNWLNKIEAIKKITEHLQSMEKGRTKITYKLRDRSVSRQRYRWAPVPIYYDSEKAPHLIPEDELPVVLPLDIKNYKPKGKSPLEDHPTFPEYKAKDGKTYRRECDTLDTFMCSSFYFLRYPDANNPDELIRWELRDKMFPVNFYCGGKEHTVWHLLYARFIHKFLYDIGYVSSPEPFQKLVHQGMVLGPDGRKMSKRRGNIIDPLDVIKQYNADVLRMYLMFMWPVESDKAWDDNGVKGIHKFLQRVEKLYTAKDWLYQSADFKKLTPEQQKTAHKQIETVLHKTIKTMTDDMKKLKYNTAISKLMILVNKIYEIGSTTKEQLTALTLMLSPFATQWAKSLRKQLWHTDNIEYNPRPNFDQNKIIAEDIELAVQINGKMRGTITVEPGINEALLIQKIQTDGKRDQYLTSKVFKKTIFIQDRIINIIT